MSARPSGWRGWYDTSVAVLDGGIVASCSDPERAAIQGILIDLPGSACAALGENLVPFLRWCTEVGRITRADWAVDDHTGHLTLKRITAAHRRGRIVTRFQRFSTIITDTARVKRAWTIYMGSRTGRSFVRIYDKAAQQGTKGHWVRFELETKRELADALTREVLEKGSDAVIMQINRQIRFCMPKSGDSNKRRWPVCPWWAAFLSTLQRGAALLAGEPVQHTIERARAWVERQVTPWLSAILTADGGDLSWLIGAMNHGRQKWKPHHHAALALATA